MYSTHYSTPYTTYQQYYTTSNHQRRATADGTYTYAAPFATYYYTVPEESKPRRSSSHRHREHVSSGKSHSKRHSYSYNTGAFGQDPYRSSGAYYSYQQQPAYYAHPTGFAGAGDEYTSAYERKYRTSPPPHTKQSFSYPHADGYTYQTQYAEYKPRERRASYAQYTAQPQPTQNPQPRPKVRDATEADARRAGIPAGYSLKHWDPTEEPILLLGSVFHADSLGKWMFDWAVACHGRTALMSNFAGDLWMVLILFAGKIKRAEGKIKLLRRKEDREMIDDYLESGERLWERINKLLKIAEESMLKKAKKKSSSKKAVLGSDSGVQFVKCVFGRDYEFDRTSKIFSAMHLWCGRFDVNCEHILKKV